MVTPPKTLGNGKIESQMETTIQKKWRGKPVVRFHTMAKPIGSACNLDCTYCYYLSKHGLLNLPTAQGMSTDVLEAFIKQYIDGHNNKEVIFSWQGGEPTLLGLDFFHRVVELQQKHAKPHMRIENDLQTNGTLLDDAWCTFLKKHDFLVGLSIDGPRDLHDVYRDDQKGNGSFDSVFNAATLLNKHKVNFSTLTCINRITGQNALRVYRFLRDEVKSKRMQFIPIVEPKTFRTTAPQHWLPEEMPTLGSDAARPGTPDSVVEDWCVDPQDFGNFLCTVFDEWYSKDLGNIYVHYFDAMVETWMGRINPLCTHGPMCGKGTALERDGSVYSCDHYVYPEYRLGNIMEKDLVSMALSPEQESFGKAKEGLLPQRCRDCDYQFACFGECPKNRFIRTPEGDPGLNYLCQGWQRFYGHIDKPIREIIQRMGGTVDIPDTQRECALS